MGGEEKPGEGAGKPGEGEGKPGEGGKPDEGGWQQPKPTGSSGKEFKTTPHEKKFGNEKEEEGAKEGGEGEAKKPEGFKKKASFGPLYKKEKSGEYSTTKKSEEDKTYASVLEHKRSLELLSGGYDLDAKKASLKIVEVKAEVSVVHAQVDLVDKIKHFFFGDPPKPPAPPPPVPMAARVGDLTMHGAPLAPGTGSTNVLIGGMPAWRATLDMHLCPAPGMPHGTGPASPGAPTVLINNMPAARMTDFIVEPTGGPDIIAAGCPTVLIGVATPPPPPSPPKEDSADLPWVKFESVAQGDLLHAEASGAIEGEVDLSKRSGKLEAGGKIGGAVLQGELPLKIRIRVPFTSYYVGLGAKVQGSLLTAEAGANARLAVNTGGKLFDTSVGAKVGAGLAGAGLTFSVDVAK